MFTANYKFQELPFKVCNLKIPAARGEKSNFVTKFLQCHLKDKLFQRNFVKKLSTKKFKMLV